MTQPKPFIEYADWPKLTPYSEQAIRKLVHRKVLREGIHWSHPVRADGTKSRKVIFDWAACVAWMKGAAAGEDDAPIDLGPERKRA